MKLSESKSETEGGRIAEDLTKSRCTSEKTSQISYKILAFIPPWI